MHTFEASAGSSGQSYHGSAGSVALIVGVLALQGGFHEHADLLRTAAKNLEAHLTLHIVFVRLPHELAQCDALILPGGESTTISLLAKNNGLLGPLREFVKQKPVWGTCAGMILLSKSIYREGEKQVQEQEGIGGVDICVVRNQYGRQLASFEHPLQFEGIAEPEKPFNAVFIRAPIVHHLLPCEAPETLRVLAKVPREKLPSVKTGQVELGPDADAVALLQGRKLVTSFHPELSTDTRVHEYFLRQLILPSLSAR